MIKKIVRRIRIEYYKFRYGKNVIIDGKDISLCDVIFRGAAYIAHNVEMQNCSIDNHSSIGRYTKVRDTNIGKYCSISWDCTIGAPEHPFRTITNSAITYRSEYGVVNRDMQFEQKKTYVGNDVWIGCGVIIISGVHIGDGAVIGAGAVVTKDIPEYEIWAGVPARKIADRFDGNIIAHLKELSWWDWSEEIQKYFIDLFSKELTSDIICEIEDRYRNVRDISK